MKEESPRFSAGECQSTRPCGIAEVATSYWEKEVMGGMEAVGVLIVEDDDATREVLTELLEDVGYRVFIASNGKPALEWLRTHPEGLVVLLDLMMPGMDGYALL